jgi:hypothetical protein
LSTLVSYSSLEFRIFDRRGGTITEAVFSV